MSIVTPLRPKATPEEGAQTTSTSQELERKALYRVSEAMTMLSMSRTVIYEQLRSGRLRSVRQGRSRRIPASAIAEYLDLLEQEAQSSAYGRRAA